jgi:hypothetical protein
MLAASVAGDEAEQPVFDRVPLAGARRQVAQMQGQAGVDCELLQLPLPRLHPRFVAAAAVGGDHQRASVGVGRRWSSQDRVLLA